MIRFFSLMLVFLSLAPFALSAESVSLKCETSIDQWAEALEPVKPGAKTCQLAISSEDSYGACARSETKECYNYGKGEWDWCTTCKVFKTANWTKKVNLACGGRAEFLGNQTCVGKNTTIKNFVAYYGRYDHSIGSLIIEHLALQGFRLVNQSEGRFFFER